MNSFGYLQEGEWRDPVQVAGDVHVDDIGSIYRQLP